MAADSPSACFGRRARPGLAAASRLVQRPAEPLDLCECLLKLRAQRGVLTREGGPFVAERLRVVRCHPPNGTEPRGICPAPVGIPSVYAAWMAVNKYYSGIKMGSIASLS